MYKKITVVGLGYVGLGQALLFNDTHTVIGYDIDEIKINILKSGVSPLSDSETTKALKRKALHVTTDFDEAIKDSELVIIATPTNFIDELKAFDLSSVITTLEKLVTASYRGPVLIKSTLHVGATKILQKQFATLSIFFSPEFLREGKALYDNYYPSRIIVGYDTTNVKQREFASKIGLLYENAAKSDVSVMLTGSNEAEAIKLFSNTYLALRVAFFNELDTYALTKSLDALEIIKGVGLDPRIGDYYNNPSFGYGGYCLPKDTKELKESFGLVPENLISATITANTTRKAFISDYIISLLGENTFHKTVGVYRLTMKKDATNMRESSMLDVINNLQAKGVKLLVFEPLLQKDNKHNFEITNDLETFKNESSLIITNRYDSVLDDVKQKVFTRDLFNKD